MRTKRKRIFPTVFRPWRDIRQRAAGGVLPEQAIEEKQPVATQQSQDQGKAQANAEKQQADKAA